MKNLILKPIERIRSRFARRPLFSMAVHTQPLASWMRFPRSWNYHVWAHVLYGNANTIGLCWYTGRFVALVFIRYVEFTAFAGLQFLCTSFDSRFIVFVRVLFLHSLGCHCRHFVLEIVLPHVFVIFVWLRTTC